MTKQEALDYIRSQLATSGVHYGRLSDEQWEAIVVLQEAIDTLDRIRIAFYEQDSMDN